MRSLLNIKFVKMKIPQQKKIELGYLLMFSFLILLCEKKLQIKRIVNAIKMEKFDFDVALKKEKVKLISF